MTQTRVLIVEDEFLIRLTLAEAFADEGFAVTEAASGDEAAALLGGAPQFGLLLTDIQLPGTMSGLELATAARSRHPELSVIYMTGRPDSALQTCLSGRDAFVAKPYLPSEVCAAARRLLAI